MQLRYSKHFLRDYAAAPPLIRRAAQKQLKLIERNLLAHPSLRAKKYDETQNLWQGRISRNWRLYFSVENGECYLHAMVSHPK